VRAFLICALTLVRPYFAFPSLQKKSIRIMLRLGLGVACLSAFWAAEAESIPIDSPRWQLEGEAKTAEYLGRRCLWLQDGAAWLKDFEMTDGVIDVDMAGSGARADFTTSFSAPKETATAKRFICGRTKPAWTTPSNIRRS